MTYEYNFSLTDNMINWEPHWKQLSKSWYLQAIFAYHIGKIVAMRQQQTYLAANKFSGPSHRQYKSLVFNVQCIVGRQYIANILYKNCLGTFPPKHTQWAKIWKKLGNT